tara:strand:+ start:2111 stop:2572 length:462 start_codon:yes stop_codon:yes gene_type:complete
MKIYKSIIILTFFIFVTSCGYAPLIDKQRENIFISSLNLDGDRQVNNIISNNLSKYETFKDGAKNYTLEILSEYKKNIINKDEKGNPKNYNLQVKIKVSATSIDGSEINKIFERNISLASKNKKITERQLEKKYKRDLSNLISQDVIFFLTNQ